MPIEDRQVVVSQLCAAASEQTLRDFFAFCGTIERVEMHPGEPLGEALLTFETEQAASTASLLSNALIADKPIQVRIASQPQQSMAPAPASESQTAATEGSQPVQSAPASQPSQFAAWAASAMLAVKKFDESNHISETAKGIASEFKSAVKAFDETHGVSRSVKGKFDELDEKHNIKEKYSQTKEAAKQKAAELKARAMENDAVANGVMAMQDAKREVSHKFSEFEDDYQAAMREKQGLPIHSDAVLLAEEDYAEAQVQRES